MQNTITFIDEQTIKLNNDQGTTLLQKVPYTKVYDKTEKQYVSRNKFYTINNETYV